MIDLEKVLCGVGRVRVLGAFRAGVMRVGIDKCAVVLGMLCSGLACRVLGMRRAR